MTEGDLRETAQLLHDALWATGGELVEGAFVDHWVSNASRAADELEERFRQHGFSEADRGLFRRAMCGEPVEAMAVLLDRLRESLGPLVLEMLYAPQPNARAAAIRVAWRFRDPQYLFDYLADPDPVVRLATLRTVAERRFNLPEAQRWVLEALSDPDPEIRKFAGSGIDFYRKPEAAAALAEAIRREQDEGARNAMVARVAEGAGRGTIYHGGQVLADAVGPELVEVLRQAWRHPDAHTRENAARVLGKMAGMNQTLAATIQWRIDALEPGTVDPWPARVFKEELNALPVHASVGLFVWGIQPDGTVVRVDLDGIDHNVEVEADPVTRHAILYRAGLRDPTLRELAARTPEGVKECEVCGGATSDCARCSGLGWYRREVR